MQRAIFGDMTIVPEKINGYAELPDDSIIKVLAYFDIFHYPLSKDEIKQFLDKPVNDAMLDQALWRLQYAKSIFRINDFYSLRDEFLLAEKRTQGNLRAERLLPKAMKIGRFLFRFPYVRAIGISGSLSKRHADENADIDFFVITKANRLWIARTLMHLFKKFTFLAGKQHFYCMNYYLDEAALQVEAKNIYTAIEIKTLLPVCGGETMEKFFLANKWANEFLPNCMYKLLSKKRPPGSWFKRSAEWMFNNKPGDHLDNFLMGITTRRWKRKEKTGKRNKKGLTMGLVTGKHYAWSNPESFQEKILFLYDQKLTELKLQHIRWPEMVSLSFEE